MLRSKSIDSRLASRDTNHLRSGACQHLALKLQHGFLVVDQQHASLQRDPPALWFSCRRRLGGCGCCRKHNLDYRAPTHMVVGADVAAVLLDDAVANTQPQTRAL